MKELVDPVEENELTKRIIDVNELTKRIIDQKEEVLNYVLAMLDQGHHFTSIVSGQRLYQPITIFEALIEEGSVNMIEYTDSLDDPSVSTVVIGDGKINVIKV